MGRPSKRGSDGQCLSGDLSSASEALFILASLGQQSQEESFPRGKGVSQSMQPNAFLHALAAACVEGIQAARGAQAVGRAYSAAHQRKC